MLPMKLYSQVYPSKRILGLLVTEAKQLFTILAPHKTVLLQYESFVTGLIHRLGNRALLVEIYFWCE